jgi:hypothetical protein
MATGGAYRAVDVFGLAVCHVCELLSVSRVVRREGLARSGVDEFAADVELLRSVQETLYRGTDGVFGYCRHRKLP